VNQGKHSKSLLEIQLNNCTIIHKKNELMYCMIFHTVVLFILQFPIAIIRFILNKGSEIRKQQENQGIFLKQWKKEEATGENLLTGKFQGMIWCK